MTAFESGFENTGGPDWPEDVDGVTAGADGVGGAIVSGIDQ